MKTKFSTAAGLLALLAAATTTAHAYFPEGDYGGADIVVSSYDWLSGVYTNVGRFVVASGATVNIEPYQGPCTSPLSGGRLEVHAREIVIDGEIQGDGMGCTGGGGGGGFGGHGGGGALYACPDGYNGGGHPGTTYQGGAGGSGDEPPTDSTGELATMMGRGGDGAAGGSFNPAGFDCQGHGGGAGGCGGAAIALFADNITVAGRITSRGTLGTYGSSYYGGSVSRYGGIDEPSQPPPPDGWEFCGIGGGAGSAGDGGDILLCANGPMQLGESAYIAAYQGGSRQEGYLGIPWFSGGSVKLFAKEISGYPRIESGWRIRQVRYPIPDTEDFAQGIAGWHQGGAPEYPKPTFHQPPASYGIEATEPYSFGYIDSPTYYYGQANRLYRARYHIASPTPATKVPMFRMRAFEPDFTQTASAYVSSATGALAPGAAGRDYDLIYASSPQGGTAQRFALDMIHFDPEDAEGSIALHRFDIRPAPITLTDRRTDALYTFDTDEGWVERGAPQLSAPEYTNGPGWLGLSPGGKDNVFGFWASQPDVVLDPSRLYIITYSVESDLTDPTRVPGFRCRVNESTLDAAATLDIASQGTALRSPTTGNSQVYTLYFQPTPGAHRARLLIAFDLVHFLSGDDSNATLRLNEVRVESAIAVPQQS